MNPLKRIININPLMALMILFSLVIGRFEEYLIIFISITIHEISHVISARYYKIEINKITVSPIGIMASINYSNSSKKTNDYVVALTGPIANLIMICVGIHLNSSVLGQSQTMSFFILSNVSLLVLNILPVLPLDGGRVFKTILLNRVGYSGTLKVFSVITKIVSGFIIGAGIIQVLNSYYNFSLLLIGIFIYLYKYKDIDLQFDFIRELYLKKQKIQTLKLIELKYFAVLESNRAIDVIKSFYNNKYNIVVILNNDLEIVGELTETQIFEGIMCSGYDATVGTYFK